MELFVLLLFGHLFGDYLLQNDWMAMNKKKKEPIGIMACFIHCFIYTVCVYIFLLPLLPQNYLICGIIIWGIFLSHFILDKTYLIDRWFRLTHGRSWKRLGIFYTEVEDIARVVFTAIVQTVADNTIHLVLMYFLCYFLL